MTTREKTKKVAPPVKFAVLAGDIDSHRQLMEKLQSGHSVDYLFKMIEVEQLVAELDVTLIIMHNKLKAACELVTQIGKKYVIREFSYLTAPGNLEVR